MAFVVETADAHFMVKTFARLAHCPQSTHRANRKFLYLPSGQAPDDAFESSLKQMFATREIDFMPDLVVAKLVTGRGVMPLSSTTTRLLTGECKMGLRQMETVKLSP
jgi:hypothetical protein